ncbi:MAG TPA: glycosyltransferase family 4 protein [Candidatus Limnocylindrales bacterium]
MTAADPRPVPTAGLPRAASADSRPVAMIVHAYYEEDSRVRRQAEWLVAHGRPVDVYALRRPDAAPGGTVGGVTVRRLPVRRHQGAGVAVYLAEYAAFLVRAASAVAAADRSRRYALVEVHSLPDYLVFAALPLRLRVDPAARPPVLLDLHEAMPEFFKSRFPGVAGPLPNALLSLQERLSIGFATHVMTVNDALGDRLVRLGVPRDKLTVILNAPDLTLFDAARHARRAFREDGCLRLVYTGALTPTYELGVVLDAVARLAAQRGDLDVRLDVYGRGDSEAALRERCDGLGLAERVTFRGRVPLEDVPAAIAASDVGLAPTRRDAFTEASLSTKLFEYAAMGKPVVASGLPTVERYFPPDSVATYRSGDPADLARAIARLADDTIERESRIARTRQRVAELSWAREAERYGELVERLIARSSTA